MKVLFVLAIIFAVAQARLQAAITYSEADCSDATKVIYVVVSDEGANCIEQACNVTNGQAEVTRCYNNINEVPIPQNVTTINLYSGVNCTDTVVTATYQLVGLAGCVVTGETKSGYLPSCGTSAVCYGNTDCSSCTSSSSALTPGECASYLKLMCGVDKSGFPAAPVSSPVSAPVSAPTGSAAPKSAPTGTSTPAKKSFASSLQVVSGASAAVLVAVALVV